MFKVKKHRYEFIMIKLQCPSEMIQYLNEVSQKYSLLDLIISLY